MNVVNDVRPIYTFQLTGYATVTESNEKIILAVLCE